MHSNLPHISKKNTYQFITFRTKDSTDEFIVRTLKQDITTSKLQYILDNHLDNSLDGAYLNGEILKIIKNYLLSLDKTLCEIIAFSIMPNHIHLLVKQYKSMAEIMKRIKGGLAFLINKELKRKGTFWQKDYFDKAIRDEKHFGVVLKYIQNNAIKAKLRDADERFYYDEKVR